LMSLDQHARSLAHVPQSAARFGSGRPTPTPSCEDRPPPPSPAAATPTPLQSPRERMTEPGFGGDRQDFGCEPEMRNRRHKGGRRTPVERPVTKERLEEGHRSVAIANVRGRAIERLPHGSRVAEAQASRTRHRVGMIRPACSTAKRYPSKIERCREAAAKSVPSIRPVREDEACETLRRPDRHPRRFDHSRSEKLRTACNISRTNGAITARLCGIEYDGTENVQAAICGAMNSA